MAFVPALANPQDVDAFLAKYQAKHSVIADSNYINSLSQCGEEDEKTLYQLLQVHYIYQGQIQSSLLNCYAKPSLFNLGWNDAKRLEAFPAKTHIAPPSCIAPLQKLTGQKFDDPDTWYVLVFWGLSTKKLSRKLIRSIKKHQTPYLPAKVEFIYVNLDVLFFM